jgi:hypothetical protein
MCRGRRARIRHTCVREEDAGGREAGAHSTVFLCPPAGGGFGGAPPSDCLPRLAGGRLLDAAAGRVLQAQTQRHSQPR